MKQRRISFAITALFLLNGGLWCFAQTPDATPALIKSPIVVFDEREHYHKGLKREDFLLEVNNQPLPIDYFSNQEAPASIVFLVDTSGSMKNRVGETSRYSFLPAAVKRFLQLTHPDNEYLIASFGLEPRIRLDWTAAPDEVFKALIALADEKPQGLTNLRDACYFGLAQARRGTKAKKVVVLVSDGQDTSDDSRVKSIKPKLLNQELMENNVQIYVLNVSIFLQAGSALSLIGEDWLNSLVRPSGGRVFSPRNAADLNYSLELLALTLYAQYEIGFYPPPAFVQSRNYKIKIRLASQAVEKYKLKNMTVRYREGFSLPR